MWKLVALVSLALAFAFGGVADAKCGICIDTVTAEVRGGAEVSTGGSTRTVHLVFSGTREHPEAVAPEYASGVVMQIDGNRTKCLSLGLNRTTDDGKTVVYKGMFSGYTPSAATTQGSYEGRLDVGGTVYEFRVPLDGTPGKITLLDVVAPPVLPQQVRAPAAAATPVPVSQAVTIDEVPAPAPGIFDRVASPDGQGALLGLAVVSFLAATLLVERRRTRGTGAESAVEA